MPKRFKLEDLEGLEIDLTKVLKGKGKEVEKILGDLLGDISRVNKTKMPLGVISEELQAKYLKWLKEKKELEEDIELEVKIEKARMENRISKKFEENYIMAENEKRKLWREIRNEMNIDEKLELNINTDTGVVSQWIDKTNEPTH